MSPNGKRKAASPAAEEPPEKTTKTAPKTLKLTYHKGDIFNAPDNTLLVHACNTQGSWGAGIAAAFKQRYPKAYIKYRDHCVTDHDPAIDAVPTASSLLIPPSEVEGKKGKPKSHYIGCLFTSAKYGRKKDKPETILANTGPAIKQLLEDAKKEGIENVRMCKINSARFGVPWERTVAVLEGIEVEDGWVGEIEVWSID
ncbi:hypothetical protein BDV96DRAFT_217903 [Lophiotrema nucula]|uniref:ADP-ribose 1''-phosphate phosphatase n=1 Tax=Lophiotrema nucula TaxID=690887 RepID=A0A6A5ZPQ5_9PLEO|nr:hypothetical protein BDV96DRAFT_217903 [Lophiotrema nucula]